MNPIKTLKRLLPSLASLTLIAISPSLTVSAQISRVPGVPETAGPAVPAVVSLRLGGVEAPALQNPIGLPSVELSPLSAIEEVSQPAGLSEAPASGISKLQEAGKALSADQEDSGGVGASSILQQVFGERSLKDEAVGAVPAAEGDAARPSSFLLRPLAESDRQPRNDGKAGKLGVDTSAMDLSVRPQDDFFRYVSGTWLKNFQMPADKSRFGAFDQLAEKSEEAVKAIIEETAKAAPAAGSDNQRVADIYKSFMNTEEIEARGLNPIQGGLARIDAIQTKGELVAAFARALRQGIGNPIGIIVDQDSKNTASYIAVLSQSGLGLPDRDYYFKDDESSAKIRAKYVEYLTKLFALSGETDAAQKAAAVFSLEKALAEHHWTRVDNRDPDKTYNKTRIDELGAAAPGFDWPAYLRAAKVRSEETEVIVAQPSYFKGFAKVLGEQSLGTWKLYLKARSLDAASAYLPDAFVQAAFEYKGRTLSGQPEMRPRWKRGVGLVDDAVGELVGQIYVQKHFPESSKQKMSQMIENLRSAYAERIKGLAWMGEETKKRALDKLSKFTPKIGYPNRWRDYSRLAVKADDLLGNVRRSKLVDYDLMVGKLGQPIDRGEWGMTPQTVNAYYNPVMNEIVFPAAILQGPFFDPEADDAVNYGAIGAVIGHEMSHGFDDEGSKFDGDGMLKDWWTKEDRAEFEARTGKLVKQFDAFEPLPGKHVNGKLTLGENIGDLGGIIVAYEAYRRSLNGREAPVIDGFTGDQRFFMGWAQVWRLSIRDQSLEQQIVTDPHAPAQYRVNGVMRNVAGFYQAFGLKEGDALFVPEKDRVKIW